MAATGAIQITSTSGALTVTFIGPAGGTPTVYSDAALTTTVSLPATVADATTSIFYVASPGAYTLSVKTASGSQIAGPGNATRTVNLQSPGTVASYSYDIRTASARGDSGLDEFQTDTESSGAYVLGVVTALGNVTGTITLDASLAAGWTATLTGDVTFDFVNVPAGKVYEPQIVATQDGTGSHTVSFSKNGSLISPQWDTGTAMTATATAGSTTVFNLQTVDGGATWFGLGKVASSSAANTTLLPADVGLVAWTAPPHLSATNKTPTAGQLWCTKVKAPPGTACTKLWYYLATIASGAANSYLAVYDQTGARLSVSANIANTDLIGANSFYRSTTMPSFTVPADGILIIAILVGSATTVPNFQALQNSAAANNAIAQDGSKGYLVFTYGSSLTVMPSSLSLSAVNCTFAAQAIMFGVGT